MAGECGKQIRLGRIIKPETGKGVAVAFDHGLDDGPMIGNIKPRETMDRLLAGGADAVLVSPGLAKLCIDQLTGRNAPALILRMDWTNAFRKEEFLGFKEGRNRLIANVEDAVRLGADAVLTFMFIGYEDPDIEAEDVERNAIITRACESYGIPHIIEPLSVGAKVGNRGYEASLIARHCRYAMEIGADAIKSDYSGNTASFKKVVEGCPIPILIAGGPMAKTLEDSLGMIRGAMDAGASGVLVGRNIIQADDPTKMLKAVRGIVHEDMSVDETVIKYLS